jgi:hypothetical protein
MHKIDNDFIRLPDIGIHGNSHHLMLEKNSIKMAGVIADWLGKRVKPPEAKETTTGADPASGRLDAEAVTHTNEGRMS